MNGAWQVDSLIMSKLFARARSDSGFTLIELLVVILIIGILAAIALPAFLNQRAKAQDASAKEAVRTAETAMETYFTDNQTYATADIGQLGAIEPVLVQAAQPATGGGNSLALTGQGPASYTLTVTSQSSGANTFSISVAGGAITRSCTTAGSGGCPASGSW